MSTKRLFAVVSMLVCFLASLAQDVIVRKDGASLLGNVIEINDKDVKYRKAENPNGPIYTIKVADLMRINYENGTIDTFGNFFDGSTTPATVLSGQTGDVTDTQLLALYNQNKTKPKLPKGLKLTAYIGGGALLVAGGILLLCADLDFGDIYDSGIVMTCAAPVWFASFYGAAIYKRNKLNRMNLLSASVYRHNIFEKDGKSFSIGIDYMANRINTRTPGLGMTYNF